MYIVDNIKPSSEGIEDTKKDIDFEYFDSYYELHKKFIQPLDIKIDISKFEHEIEKYHSLFRTWDQNRPHLPRYGISLVNDDGDINKKIDLGCAVFDHRNKNLPVEKHLHERLFKVKTEVLSSLDSLRPLDVIGEFMLRSNILLWHKGASFLPHLDTFPKLSSNLRLWGVNDVKNYVFRTADGDCMVNVEPGRIYLIDTTKFHYAKALENWIYTFFLALDNTDACYQKLKELLIE